MPEELDLPEIEDNEEDVDHHVEKLETLMVSTETALLTLRGLHERLAKTNEVDRSVAKTIHMLTTGMESMDRHFEKYPTASYTALPGTTNLKVTQEGLLGSIGKAILDAIKAMWKYICDSVKSMFKTKSNNKDKFEQSRKAVTLAIRHMPEVKEFPIVHDTPAEFTTAQMAVLARLNSSQQALWCGASNVPSNFCFSGKPNWFLESLFYNDSDYLKKLTNRFERLAKVISDVTPGTNVSNGTLDTFLHQHTIAVDETGVKFYYTDDFHQEMIVHRREVERPGEYAYLILKHASEAKDKAPGKLPPIETKESLREWLEIAKKFEVLQSSVKSEITPSICSAFERSVNAIDTAIEKLCKHTELTQEESEVLHAISKDVKWYVQAMSVYESLMTQSYTATLIALQVLATDWS